MNHSAKQSDFVQGVLIEGVFDKNVAVAFDAANQSSDGGALLLGGLDHTLGLSRRFVASIRDLRQKAKVEHDLIEMVRFRLYKLCCGYDDLNDADTLRDDPLFKFLCDFQRDAHDIPLASPATLCRLENSIDRRDLLRIGHALMDWQLEHQRSLRPGRVRRITIDLDPTDNPAYGQQQFIAFNTHYDNHVFLPMLAFITFHDERGAEEAEQYLVAAMLRPGSAGATEGARGMLRELIAKLRKLFPGVIVDTRELRVDRASPTLPQFRLNPKRIMTGLDLIAFSSLIWFQTGYSTHVLRQASARARRPIQTKPCKVFFLSTSRSFVSLLSV